MEESGCTGIGKKGFRNEGGIPLPYSKYTDGMLQVYLRYEGSLLKSCS